MCKSKKSYKRQAFKIASLLTLLFLLIGVFELSLATTSDFVSSNIITLHEDDGSGGCGGGGSGGGSDGGSEIQIKVEIMGLDSETVVRLEKTSDGHEAALMLECQTLKQEAVFNVSKGGSCTITGSDVSGYKTPDPITVSLTHLQGAFDKEESLIYEKIDSISLSQTEISLFKGYSESLDASVLTSDENISNIVWTSNDSSIVSVDDFGIINAHKLGTTSVYATSEDGKYSAEFIVTVQENDTSDGTLEDKISLFPENLSIFEGQEESVSIVESSGLVEDLTTLTWSISNPDIAQIVAVSEDGKTATIKAITSGSAVISVSDNDNTIMASSYLSVAIDPTVTDPAYIVATTFDSADSVDQFENENDVYIRCYGLPQGKYHIKIDDQGNRDPLGQGTVNISGNGEELFQLYKDIDFKATTKFSASYFVSMSLDPTYPSGDDESGLPKTFMDNFKIGSPIPTGFIDVDVHQLIGEQLIASSDLEGYDVILGREISEYTALETQYEHYLNPLREIIPDAPLYTDEVKLIGHIDENGIVVWDTPKEKLKIGGYILLIELPDGFTSNLDTLNPESEDGELLKEVHIRRNVNIKRSIVVQYQPN